MHYIDIKIASLSSFGVVIYELNGSMKGWESK
jgi:hypothetical protein